MTGQAQTIEQAQKYQLVSYACIIEENHQCTANEWNGISTVARQCNGGALDLRSRVRLPAGVLQSNLGELSLPSLQGR